MRIYLCIYIYILVLLESKGQKGAYIHPGKLGFSNLLFCGHQKTVTYSNFIKSQYHSFCPTSPKFKEVIETVQISY